MIARGGTTRRRESCDQTKTSRAQLGQPDPIVLWKRGTLTPGHQRFMPL